MEDKIRKIMDESTNYQTGEVDAEIAISKLLDLFSVSGSFTAEDMEEAYRDGYENDYPREWDFNIDNYR